MKYVIYPNYNIWMRRKHVDREMQRQCLSMRTMTGLYVNLLRLTVYNSFDVTYRPLIRMYSVIKWDNNRPCLWLFDLKCQRSSLMYWHFHFSIVVIRQGRSTNHNLRISYATDRKGQANKLAIAFFFTDQSVHRQIPIEQHTSLF